MVVMTPTRHDPGAGRLADHELEAMLERAAEECARRALNNVGRGGKDAVLTIHDVQSLLECTSSSAAPQYRTAVHVTTTGVLVALLAGISLKPRWFGPNP
jgi:Family of unknown function (DUF6127)